jgi:hypothetical protein
MAKRKTVTIEFLVNMTNDILKDSAADRVDVRQGAMNLLETVLHSTGNYNGFRYLMTVVDGNPGVNHAVDGKLLNGDARFANTDRTRVEYFLP